MTTTHPRRAGRRPSDLPRRPRPHARGERRLQRRSAPPAAPTRRWRWSSAHAPDLALLDISMPGGGIEAARRVRAASPGHAHRDADGVGERRGRGRRAPRRRDRLRAEGHLGSGADRRSSTGVARGEAHVSPALAARILGDFAGPAAAAARGARSTTLTRREEDILRRVARGMSNREVAEALAHPGEDGQALHDLDPGEARGPQPRRGDADRPRGLARVTRTRSARPGG